MENILKNHLFAARVIALFAVFSLLATAFAFVAMPTRVIAQDDDNVDVTATVEDFVSLTISDATLQLSPSLTQADGSFNIGNADTTVTVSSNDDGGYQVTIVGTNGELVHETEGSEVIPSTGGTVDAGEQEEFGANVPSASCDATTVEAAYDNAEDGQTTGSVGEVPTVAANIFSHGAAASGHECTLRFRASSTNDTVPGDYDDTVTLTVTAGT